MDLVNAYVIDLYRYDDVTNWSAVAQSGVAAVIHKATQGTNHQDDQYADRRVAALGAGLLWGAYHFGTGDDPGADQAKFFLDTVQPDAQTVLAIDFENNGTKNEKTMSLDQLIKCVSKVNDETGRWPLLYGGSYLNDQLSRATIDLSVLASCPLWYKQYPASWVTAPQRTPTNWSTFTLWQYTDGKNGPGPRTVEGVNGGAGGKGCDRSQFNGDLDALNAFWKPSAPATATGG